MEVCFKSINVGLKNYYLISLR